MMRIIAVLCLLCASVHAQVTEPPPATAGANPIPAVDREAFTFTRYQLNVSLDAPRHGVAARGTVVVRNDSQQAQMRVPLQISSSLKWAAVRAAGKSLDFTVSRLIHDIDHTGAVNEAVAALPSALRPGESIELEVGYQGTIDLDATRLRRLGMPVEVATRSDWDQISESFTAVRGVGYVTWYPVALEPATLDDGNKVFQELGVWRSRHADSSFRVTYRQESDETLIASGERISEEEPTFFLERMGLGGPFFVIADFKLQSTSNGRVFYRVGSGEAARQVSAALSRLEPEVSNGRTSPAFIVELPAGWAAFENGAYLLTPFAWRSEKEMELQVEHVLTHANFYSPRPWIYEGLAHVAQAALLEKQDGRAAALGFLEQRRLPLTLIAPTESGPNDARNSLINASDEIYFRSKAMWVWWMLREMLGPDVVRKAMAAYKPEADKEPAYVQRLLEAASGKDLEWFFDDWVYRDRGLADFKVVSVYPRQNMKGSYLVTVTVENLGRAGAEVPIRIKTADGQATGKLIVKGKSQASVRIETAQPPVEVRVNDGSVLESDETNNSFTVPEKD